MSPIRSAMIRSFGGQRIDLNSGKAARNRTGSVVLALTLALLVTQESRERPAVPTVLLFSSEFAGHPLAGLVCGGALISPQTVLTAAHCFEGVGSDRISVATDAVSLCLDLDPEEVHQVVDVWIDPRFDPETLAHDIAIARLDRESDGKVYSLSATRPREGQLGQVYGWSPVSFELQDQCYAHLKSLRIVDPTLCIADDSVNSASIVCARPEVGGKNTCGGDSGSPILVDGKIAGVTSWGPACGEFDVGVYASTFDLKHIEDDLKLREQWPPRDP